MRSALSTCEGYTWQGGGATLMERSAEGRRHRRKQQAMCARYMRYVEEEASLSLDAQVRASLRPLSALSPTAFARLRPPSPDDDL